MDDNLLQETEVEAPSNLDTLDTTVLSPASSDVTDGSGEVATTFQGQRKSIDGTNWLSSRKRKKSKFDMIEEMLDKLIGMQEKSEGMARRKADGDGYSDKKGRERISTPNDEYANKQYSCYVSRHQVPHQILYILVMGMVAMIHMPHKMTCK